jgi:geranylgeranyl pyrophosphate synthase
MTTAAAPGAAGFCAEVANRLIWLTGQVPAPLRSPVGDLAGRPGKLLRPMLVWASAGFGSADPARLVRLGALVELLHLASLVHDDVIDATAVRRGAPAAHTVVGCERATLAGLACFAVAGMEAADLGGGLDRLVSRTVAGLSYGEMLDVERAFQTSLAIADYLELVERKTGDLFRLSCLLGATEAGVSPDGVQVLAAFGADFGVAFQVLDDCLDLSVAGGGKPAGTDHLLGLFGAPTLYALTRDETGELKTLLLSPGFTVSDMPRVRALVTALGGIAAAERLARERYRAAVSSLHCLPGPAAGLLIDVCEVAWQRRG